MGPPPSYRPPPMVCESWLICAVVIYRMMMMMVMTMMVMMVMINDHYDKVQVNGHGCDEDRHHAQEPGGGGGVSEAQLLNPSSLQVGFSSSFSIHIFKQSLLFTSVIISFSRSFLRVICCGLLTFFPSSLWSRRQGNLTFSLYMYYVCHMYRESWKQTFYLSKIYKTGFSGKKIYALKVQKPRLFLLKKKHRKCINISYSSRFFARI